MSTDQPGLAVQVNQSNSGLQPVVTNPTKPNETINVPSSLLNPNPINLEQVIRAHSSPKPSSPLSIQNPPTSNSHGSNKRDIILVLDPGDSNKPKHVKLETNRPEMLASNDSIEELKKQIEEEEAKLKAMRQLRVHKVVTTHSPQLITTLPTTSMNSAQNRFRSKPPIIIHGSNDLNRNISGKKYLINSEDHKPNSIIITRPDNDGNKRVESKPTIIHGMHKDNKLIQQSVQAEAISPSGLEPEEFKELKELQSKIKSITQKYSIPMPTSKHNNLFISKHNHPKRQLSKMIERKLIKAQLPPTNRQVWPIIPFADNNFQYAVGLEEAVLYVTGEPDEFSELHKKSRIVCIACGCDFGSCWQGSKSAFFCEACDSARQMKEHRNALVTHLNTLMKEVDADEKEFDKYTDILLKQQTRLQQTQQQQQPETYAILSQLSDGKYHIPANTITLSNASGQRINTGTVIHQKQDNIQYVAVNTSDNNTKLQPIAGFYIQQNPNEKSKNGQVNTGPLRTVYTTQVETKPVLSSHKK